MQTEVLGGLKVRLAVGSIGWWAGSERYKRENDRWARLDWATLE